MSNKTWAFIDYENVGTLEGINLALFDKVYIFIGATQNKISLGNEAIDLLTEIHLLKLKAVSPDNLDFHISYYLGRFDASTKPNIRFTVISNDSGFDPLLSHIIETGRPCERLKTRVLLPKVQTEINQHKKPSEILSQINKVKQPETKAAKHNIIKDELLPHLIKAASNRPAKEDALKNFIKSHVISLRNDSAGVDELFNALIEKKLIKLEGKKITYSLKKIKQ